MQRPPACMPIEVEVERVRTLSKSGRHSEALALAEALDLEMSDRRDLLYLAAANQRCLNRIPEALATLQRLEQQHPRFSLLYQERGYCCLTLRDIRRAVECFSQAVEINPALVASWSMLERLYGLTEDRENAALATERMAALLGMPPEVVRAGSLFSDGELAAADNILRAYLLDTDDDVEALRLLGRIERQRDRLRNAEGLFEAALKLAPNYLAARLDYVDVLMARQKYLRAREEINDLLQREPGNTHYLSLSAAAYVGIGELEQAIDVYRQLLAASPKSADLQVALGHTLKTVGQQKQATACYQRAAGIRRSFGDAWWSLANLKSYRFSAGEIECMRAEEAALNVLLVDRYHLCFALGKALEDQHEYAESWQFYARGNELKRTESGYQPDATETNTRQQIELCTAQFFAERSTVGVPDVDPIFIVGLPRSGSTLVEQILASHSQVEGTQELPDIQRLVLELQGESSGLDYPGVLAQFAPEAFRSLGERYMADTRVYRKTPKPLFLDKMPNNFRHLGLIHLMLPNAKIIDVRREPMACCFSNLKQLFASGQDFTYSMEDMAYYYRTYLDLMQHWNAVLPGRIMRVCYEDVVEDLTGNVHRLLEFCGLPFEPACVEFYKTERSIRTPSSEQVRQPISRDGLVQWRNYAAWLGPLKEKLGDALLRYRA